jgi:hypothetical protein
MQLIFRLRCHLLRLLAARNIFHRVKSFSTRFTLSPIEETEIPWDYNRQ